MADHSIRYKVIIVGHEPPFKWSVYHKTNNTIGWQTTQVMGFKMSRGPSGGTTMEEGKVSAKGTADTFENCLKDATETATQSEWERQHAATRYEEEILLVESADIEGIQT